MKSTASISTRSPSTPWLYYVPVALVMLSFVQEGNTLFGYAFSWYIVLLALAGAIYLLDRPTLTWPTLAGGIVIAIRCLDARGTQSVLPHRKGPRRVAG